jgi:hypothetical protein
VRGQAGGARAGGAKPALGRFRKIGREDVAEGFPTGSKARGAANGSLNVRSNVSMSRTFPGVLQENTWKTL